MMAGRNERVAYLVNRYPAVTHTFITREIRGVGAAGIEVRRFALRRADDSPLTAADREEIAATRVALDAGYVRLCAEMVATALTHPVRAWRALEDALRASRRSGRGVVRHLAYFAYACVLRRWLERDGVTHLHVHMGGNAALVAVLCRRLGGPPFSFTVHGPEEFDRPDAISLALKIERAEFVVGISDFAVHQLQHCCAPELWPRIHLIGCGVDASWLERAVTSPPLAPHFVCVGRLCEAKMQHVLLEALAKLVQQGREVTLTLVGDGPTRPMIEKRVVELALTRHVQLIGWADEVRVMREIEAARALVLPSAAEGLPVVIMEAMARGRPVISTPVAGIPELVEPEVTGWVVPVGDVDALAAALEAVLDVSPATLLAMGRAGREVVERRHDARRNAEDLARRFLIHTEGS